MPVDPLSATKAFLTIGRATTWVTKLAKVWKGIRAERRKELAIAAEDFGNLEALAEVYIEPDCQPHNPADVDEEDPMYKFRMPAGTAIGDFLKSTHREHDGSHVVFILSDAGMGKSSLLMMLKLSHDVKKFWPSDVRFELVKIDADTTDRLEAMSDKPHTVLLLDALDEDPAAWGRIEERLKELLQASKAFRQVILTCRTQFFPKRVEDPRFGRVVVAGFRCNLFYLSPFSDAQIRAHLSIQEFFVAESFVLGETSSPLQVTDQILEFLKGWIVADRTRAREFRWELLDYAKAEDDLPRLGHLINAELNSPRVQRAVADLIEGAPRANLSGAYLSGAYLISADLTDADLSGAHLSDAKLSDAKLSDAKLSGADLTDAYLTDADLTRANLTYARYLTQEQINAARGNEETKLPSNLERPAHWK